MKTKKETLFKSYIIELDSLEEVMEFAGILAQLRNSPGYITNLYNELSEVCNAPMMGLYTGDLKRNGNN